MAVSYMVTCYVLTLNMYARICRCIVALVLANFTKQTINLRNNRSKIPTPTAFMPTLNDIWRPRIGI